jgi:hypothetical protein
MVSFPSRAGQSMLGLLDLNELGLSVQFGALSQAQIDEARHKLAQAGVLDTKKSGVGGHNYMVLNIPCPDVGKSISDVAELVFEPSGHGAFRITNASSIKLHPMRYLRQGLGLGLGQPPSIDGNDNYIGPTPLDCTALYQLQRAYVVESLERVLGALDAALPPEVTVVESRLWARRLEACQDIPLPDAVSKARVLAFSTLAGSRVIDRSVYRSGMDIERGYAVGRWRRTKHGSIYKSYAKARNLLRLELSCLDRDAIVTETGRVQAPLSGAGAGELIDGFMEIARTSLCELYDHAFQVLDGCHEPSDLACGLLPLAIRMSGAATGGRSVGERGRNEATNAYNALILTGHYEAAGLRLGTGLRTTLDALCGPTGPLVKHPCRCVYSVHPSYTRAGHALALAA